MDIGSDRELTLRSARELDAAALADLSTQLGYPTHPEEALGRFKAICSKPDHSIIVALNPGEGIVGFVHVHERLLVETPPFSELGGLAVDRDHQQQGIGRHLLTAAERWSVEHGLTRMRIRTNVVREAAHAFYTRMGYRTLKKQTIFIKDLSSSYLKRD
jgi:GNAT superfamily N-acetyltransferase